MIKDTNLGSRDKKGYWKPKKIINYGLFFTWPPGHARTVIFAEADIDNNVIAVNKTTTRELISDLILFILPPSIHIDALLSRQY